MGDRAPRFAGYQPEGPVRLVVATTDPTTLPHLTTWYLATNLPRPDGAPGAAAPFAPADLAAIVRLYGLRNWVEQGYKQVKRELGWGDFQVRTDRAIRRHWALVGCAFSFCWRVWFTTLEATWPARPPATRGATGAPATPAVGGKDAGGRGAAPHRGRGAAARPPGLALLAGRAPPSAQLARALDQPVAHLARLGQVHPAPRTPAGSSTSSPTATLCTSISVLNKVPLGIHGVPRSRQIAGAARRGSAGKGRSVSRNWPFLNMPPEP